MPITPERQYELLLDSSRDESSRYWIVFNVMVAINGGLFAVAGVGFRDENTVLTSIFGCIVCLAWALIQRRLRFYVGKWKKKLKDLEENHGVLPENRKVYNSPGPSDPNDPSDPNARPRRWHRDGVSSADFGVRLADFFFALWFFITIAAIWFPIPQS